MPALRKYPQEVLERAMRLVQEACKEDPELSVHHAVMRIGQRVGVNPDTLRGWVKQAQIDAGERPGTTSETPTVNCVSLSGAGDGDAGRGRGPGGLGSVCLGP